MVFSPFKVREAEEGGKGFCEASKPLKRPPFPSVTNTNTTFFFFSELVPPNSLLAVGVVPAAGWGNSNQHGH